jgi:ADP-heptose:LPS heptosyltransferase
VDIHVLQRGRARRECPADFGIDSGTDDVLEAARVMRALDLVITVDSMPAHLAGALGMPVWTLLIDDADWRWMTGRDDSPWYPTMRLFRQPAPDDWPAVIRRVAEELRTLAEDREQRAMRTPPR